MGIFAEFGVIELVVRWVFCVFATYRFSHVLAYELGPNAVFEKIRRFLRNKYGAESLYLQFMLCPLCTSFWISLILYPVFFWHFPITQWYDIPSAWFSVGGGVLVLHKLITDSR